MSLTSLTQAQRSELGTIHTRYLVDWTLGSTTLHLSDHDFRYLYGSSSINYESYLKSIDGIGEVVSVDGNPSNSEVTLELFNQPWSTYSRLSLFSEDELFNRSPISIYELRYYDGETFATDVRTCHFKGVVEEVFDITQFSFRLRCSSRLFDKRNAWGLSKVDRATYPYCSPADDGKWRNIAYGNIEQIPCRCVKTGAIDLLSADITATQTTITTQGLRRFQFESSGTIQVGTELIPYTSWSAATETFSGCTRSNGSAHSADDPVMQVLTRFVYEAGKHPYKSISKVSVDDYDNTDDGEITAYTGGSGDELAGYEGRSVVEVVVPSQLIVKVVNKDKDKHTHTTNSVVCRMPNSVVASSSGATDGANCYDRNRDSYGYLVDAVTTSYFDFSFTATTGTEPTVTKVKIWFLLEAYSGTYGSQLRGNVTITHNGLTVATIAHGTSLPKQWVSYEITATTDFVDYDAGYRISKDATGESLTYLRIYETYVEKYTNGSKINPTGGTGWSATSGYTVSNLYDGNTSTYTYPLSSPVATFAADTNSNVPKKITTRILLETTRTAAAGDLIIDRDNVRIYSAPAQSTISKQWIEYVDNDPYNRGASITFGGTTIGLITSIGLRVYEVYIMVEESSTGIDPYEATKQVTADSIRGGLHTAQLVVGDEVTVDAETRYDDGSGTITGTPGALITRPDHVLKHFLTSLMGQSSTDIGSSFAASGTEYAALGYQFAFLAHDIVTDGQQLIYKLASQARSLFYEWGGQYHLKFQPDAAPSADFALESDDLIPGQFPMFSYASTRKGDTANKITCFYCRDYRSQKRSDTTEARKLDPDAASKGFLAAPLSSSYGAGDIEEELTLTAVRDQAHAQNILDWTLAQKQTPKTYCQLACKWRAIQTQPGHCFSYTDALFGAGTYRLLDYRPQMEENRIDIKGVKL